MDELLQRILSLLPRKADGTLVHGCKKALTDYLGLPSNTMAEWISGRNKSYRNYVGQIAKYYGVSPSWLLGMPEEQKKYPADFSEVDQELFDLMTKMRDRPELRILMHNAERATPEQVQGIADMLARFKQG